VRYARFAVAIGRAAGYQQLTRKTGEEMSLTRKLARTLTDYNNPRSVGSRLRARRIAPLLRIVEEVHERRGAVSIVDVGGTEAYWGIVPSSFLDRHDVRITLVNLPGTGLGGSHGRFDTVEADGCELGCFADRSFDIAHSNSVLEHVGEWSRMVAFGGEMARVASVYFVQTPNFWFPIEPHAMMPFFHWLPKRIRVWLVMHSALGHWSRGETQRDALAIVESARLLRRRELQTVLPASTITTEWLLGLPKSLVAIGPGQQPGGRTERST